MAEQHDSALEIRLRRTWASVDGITRVEHTRIEQWIDGYMVHGAFAVPAGGASLALAERLYADAAAVVGDITDFLVIFHDGSIWPFIYSWTSRRGWRELQIPSPRVPDE